MFECAKNDNRERHGAAAAAAVVNERTGERASERASDSETRAIGTTSSRHDGREPSESSAVAAMAGLSLLKTGSAILDDWWP